MSGKLNKRTEGWELRLDQFVEIQRDKPYMWGSNDCMCFAAKAIQVLGINHDIIADYRGKYNSAKTAAKIIKTKKEGIKAWAIELLSDYPQIHNHSVKRGDIVLINYEGVESMGVCVGSEVAVLGPKGLEFIPMNSIINAWGIGHK